MVQRYRVRYLYESGIDTDRSTPVLDTRLSYNVQKRVKKSTKKGRLEGHGMIHLVVKHLTLARSSGRNQTIIQNAKNIITNLCQFSLDFIPILLDKSDLSLVAL